MAALFNSGRTPIYWDQPWKSYMTISADRQRRVSLSMVYTCRSALLTTLSDGNGLLLAVSPATISIWSRFLQISRRGSCKHVLLIIHRYRIVVYFLPWEMCNEHCEYISNRENELQLVIELDTTLDSFDMASALCTPTVIKRGGGRVGEHSLLCAVPNAQE